MTAAKMSWIAAERRWKAKYKGCQLTFSPKQHGFGPAKKHSILAANEYYRKRCLEIDLQDALEQAKQAATQQDLEDIEALVAAGTSPIFAAGVIAGRKRERTQRAKEHGDVGSWVARYLATKSIKPLHKKRNNIYRLHAEYFRDYAGASKPIDVIDAELIDRYFTHVHQQEYSADYKKQRIYVARQIVRYAYERKALPELPRNLDSSDYSVRVEHGTPEHRSADQLRAIVAGITDERMRLNILLMLNCLMTQQDVVSLKPTEVDWHKGRIKRTRSKRQHAKNSLVIDYPLWPETFALLKKHGKQSGEFVLSERGNEQDAQLIAAKWDAKVCNLKVFRASSAQLLNEHEQYKYYARYALGHARTNIADKHYIKPSQTEFDAAIKWLGEQIGK